MDLFEIQRSCATPWNADRRFWDGGVESVDGTDTTIPAADDVTELIAHWEGEGWETTEVVVVRLADGRFVSWVNDIGPTGSGFSRDAYGGDAVIWFSSSLEAAVSKMSAQERELIQDQL